MSVEPERPQASPPPTEPSGVPPEIASFVLRFTQDRWQEPAGRQRARWRGHIRHVQSDAEARFTDFADAVAFMQAELARMTLASVADEAGGEQASLLRESLRIWERVASGYAEALGGVVQEGLGESERYHSQALDLFEKTLGAWKPWLATAASGGKGDVPDEAGDSPQPSAARLERIEARLEALTRAVEALAARFEPEG